ncbi:MAG: 2-amino-4-hydroxy-6-hydroxymethyldihydropteridine diphosphokinase [Parvibaculaceae bacterium]
MILIGIGSNVEGPWGLPRDTVEEALRRLDRDPVRLVRASRLLVTAPYGIRDQPDFVNAVARVETELPPAELMRLLQDIELAADRRRTLRWGPRTLDLDLLDYDGKVEGAAGEGSRRLILPHPGIPDRPFVLKPIAEIAPEWRHPVLHDTAQELLDRLPAGSEGGEVSGRSPRTG